MFPNTQVLYKTIMIMIKIIVIIIIMSKSLSKLLCSQNEVTPHSYSVLTIGHQTSHESSRVQG